MTLRIEPLSDIHDRAAFHCGIDSLDRYLLTQAGQDMRRFANAVFVLIEPQLPSQILGFYTLCATSIAPGLIPEQARKHLPRYPQVSATLLGRLAVAQAQQGTGLGASLVVNALRRARQAADTIGSSMVVVDALDERAAAFYVAHGFLRLVDSNRLVLPIRTIDSL